MYAGLTVGASMVVIAPVLITFRLPSGPSRTKLLPIWPMRTKKLLSTA